MYFLQLFLVIYFYLFSATQLHAARLVFEPDDLQKLVNDAVRWTEQNQATTERQLDYLYEQLKEQYPGKLNQKPRWILNQKAAALGQLKVLYCSPQEYLIFFGSSIGTDGHSGRYQIDIWDFVLAGEMRTAPEGQLERVIYRPGERAFLPRGKAKAYRIPDYGYMLEYGRGNVASSLKQGVLLPAAFITQDWKSMIEQLQDCGGLALKNIWGKSL